VLTFALTLTLIATYDFNLKMWAVVGLKWFKLIVLLFGFYVLQIVGNSHIL
jgi:hypothetical protein